MSNRYKVPVKQWRKWTDSGRAVFNELYGAMKDQGVFAHPEAPHLLPEHWRTTRWNAAWWAAETISRREKAVAKRAAQPQPNKRRPRAA